MQEVWAVSGPSTKGEAASVARNTERFTGIVSDGMPRDWNDLHKAKRRAGQDREPKCRAKGDECAGRSGLCKHIRWVIFIVADSAAVGETVFP